MSVIVLNPGPRTTFQDRGRFGLQGRGFSPGGAMDRDAMVRANFLVNNDRDEAVLEWCMIGPVLRFEEPAWLAVSGGDCSVQVDGVPYAANTVFRVLAGQTVQLLTGSWGVYGYLAVGGGWDVPELLGSRSTSLKYGLGRALRKDDRLELRRPMWSLQQLAGRSLPAPPKPGKVLRVRVIPGPQEVAFTKAGLATFYANPYFLTNECDRMGLRMEGPAVETVKGSDIISDGTVPGSIQITGNGKPIVMMADRQTTGGYAKIATVASVDLPLLAQRRPGEAVEFVRIDVEQAQQLLRQKNDAWKALRWANSAPVLTAAAEENE